MRRTAVRPRAAALLMTMTAMAATTALTGCGVPTSDVIEAGVAASGLPAPTPTVAPEPTTVPLFFLTDGEVTAYPRSAADAGDLTSAVRLLFEGPNEKERSTDATTDLPRLKAAPTVRLTDGTTVTVALPAAPTPLTSDALLQLTCTVGHAAPPHPRPSGVDVTPRVHVTGTGWTMTSPTSACPAGASAEVAAKVEAEAAAEASAQGGTEGWSGGGRGG